MDKLCIFIGHYKPGYLAGGPIQSISNLCDNLSKDYDIHIITQNHDFQQAHSPFDLENDVWLAQDNGTHVKYLSPFRYHTFAIGELFKLKPSIIYINSLFSIASLVALFCSLFYKLFFKCTIVVAPRGELDPGALSLKASKKRLVLGILKTILKRSFRFHATTTKEKNYIQLQFPFAFIGVAENIPEIRNTLLSRKKVSSESNFFFLSRITQKKNLGFAIDVLSKVRVSGTLNFEIIGPFEDEVYWQQCLDKLAMLPPNIKYSVKGPISHKDLELTFRNNHYLFFPSLAENFGHVIFEALISGVPILISDNTPWKNGLHQYGVIANSLSDQEKFIKDVELLHGMHQIDYDEISRSAFNYASSSINLTNIKEQYLNLFKNV